jgi:predicted nucleic acid-binding protein
LRSLDLLEKNYDCYRCFSDCEIGQERRRNRSSSSLIEEHTKGKEKIIVPSLLFYEVANALLYAKELENKEISEFLEILDNLDFEIIELTIKDIIKATVLGREKNITVYDASYLILAQKLGVNFITANQKSERFEFCKSSLSLN